ncbi:DegT/DnrJ/EryC1/StrS family aminotransferase [Pararhizobium antarcticum]|uniref:Pyridoxamine 5-phosphate oxidase n=1 Tax=Pararhizobium antarcticum TaxID=1798805 RepID=A0A657LM64_9HYPH|nr:DegT/DnrJ/EryC1/StrS family aminotransferase [Pararhizobium antarcticum]OJF89686.1 pyridoxamine 5-phosphate oxidase [Rhizobium sp. 58]OJF90109.1 pyridoxamine 5-phosphate oxidase [Pararhizobium antarcticum]
MINLPLATDTWDHRELEAIQRVVDSRMFTMGPYVAEYERQFADFFGSRFAVMVNSGSTANLLMVAALFFTKNPKLKRGDEVIVPAVSWSTTYYPFHQYGLKLVFVDIDPLTLNMDMKKLEAAINDRTKAICLVNLLGNPNDFSAVKKIIGQREITLLEDNCESMGATFEDRQAGTFGLMGTFSSFYSHHIATMEGGCIVTEDEEIYHILLSLRAHGWTRNLPKFNHCTGEKSDDAFEESFKFVLPGYNVRPLEMSGAIGQEQLKKLPGFISKRRDNGRYFQDLFGNHPYLQIQAETGLSSWFGFAITIRQGSEVSRSYVLEKLKQNGVDVRPIVTGNFVKNEVIKYFDYEVSGNLSAAEYIDTNGLFIGNHQVDIKDELRAIRSLFG